MVVGGVSAVLQGASVVTWDLDVVHQRSPDNIRRLLAVLRELDAFYRTQPEQKLRPEASQLSAPGHQLLMTRYGPLDLLGEIGRGHGYEDLLTDCIEMELAPELRLHVLGLRKLIEVKRETAGEKDLAVLPLLERTLKESEGL